MKKAVRLAGCAACLCLAVTIAAQPQTEKQAAPPVFSRIQRQLGTAVLADCAVKDGVLSFRVPSGGCTDKSSFRVNVRKETDAADKVPHYELTVERIKADDCKGFFPEGAAVAFDLEKDLGLKGRYTVSLANPLAPRAADGL